MAFRIIQGTTPTITYTFSVVQPSELTKAYLSIRQDGEILIEKSLEEATIGAKSLSWDLTQEETLSMKTSTAVYMMVNWLTATGVRGASEKTSYPVESNYKGVVI